MEQITNTDIIKEEITEPVQAEEKLFTQADVDEIVRKRLSRLKTQHENAGAASDRELMLRSNRLDCKEYILENGLPKELLDVIDTSDVAAFKEKVEKLQSAGVGASKANYPSVKDGGEVNLKSEPDLSQAFSKNATTHKPKKYKRY